MRLFDRSLKTLFLIVFIILTGLLAAGVCNAASYILLAPPGTGTFIDRTGTGWTPDANGMVTVTDPSIINGFLNAGFVLLPQSAATASHNYGAASSGAGLTWTLAPGEIAAEFLIAANAGAAVTAIAPPYPGQLYFVYNNSGYALTFMAASQTGIVIPNGRTAFVRGNGTDFVYATDDAIVPNASIWNGTVPIVLKKEGGTSYAANGAATTVDGTTYTVPAGLLAAGKALRITVYGTISGANAAKGVNLYFGTSAVSSPRFITATVGNFKAEFLITEYTDTAHQQISAFAVAGTVGGATTNVASDSQQTTVSIASAVMMKTQVYSNNAGDTVTQTACTIELLP